VISFQREAKAYSQSAVALVDSSIILGRFSEKWSPNEIIRQTSPDRTHVIKALRHLESGKLVKADSKNWKFGQKKLIVPTGLGFEIETLMEDLDRYNEAYSRFTQIQREISDLVDTPATRVEKDHIEVVDRSGTHKVKDKAEAHDLIMRIENAERSKLRSMGWTDKEIELRDLVHLGLSLVNLFCDRNIFSALANRYTFTFHIFNLYKNEIAGNILSEIIVSEQKKQLSNLLMFKGSAKRGFEIEEGDASMNEVWNIMHNQIVEPIIEDLKVLFDVEKYVGPPEEEELEETKRMSYSLLFNRFVSSHVKNVIGCFLKVLHHYTKENTTPLIEQFRTFQSIGEDVISKRKRRLSSNEKLELEVCNEYDSMIENWIHKDD
jgi:hypothetical protein